MYHPVPYLCISHPSLIIQRNLLPLSSGWQADPSDYGGSEVLWYISTHPQDHVTSESRRWSSSVTTMNTSNITQYASDGIIITNQKIGKYYTLKFQNVQTISPTVFWMDWSGIINVYNPPKSHFTFCYFGPRRMKKVTKVYQKIQYRTHQFKVADLLIQFWMLDLCVLLFYKNFNIPVIL
jgi:hypothetical protein